MKISVPRSYSFLFLWLLLYFSFPYHPSNFSHLSFLSLCENHWLICINYYMSIYIYAKSICIMLPALYRIYIQCSPFDIEKPIGVFIPREDCLSHSQNSSVVSGTLCKVEASRSFSPLIWHFHWYCPCLTLT